MRNIVTCLAGTAEATQQYADLMWRPGSPQGYQPPTLNPHSHNPGLQQQDGASLRHAQSVPSPFQQQSRLDSYIHSTSRPMLEQRSRSRPLQNAEPHSADSTRPGTPPAATGHYSGPANASVEPGFGYQPLLEPLLPVSDLLQSSPTQQPAQNQQAFRGGNHAPFRAHSFPIVPSIPALSSPMQRPPSHHSQSPQPSEPSQGTLQSLNVPLDPHERQLLNNLLRRSHSTRSQDRSSDQSQSSTSTHMDSQPLSLPRTWSARRLTTGSLMMHDTTALQESPDLSRYICSVCATTRDPLITFMTSRHSKW